MGEPAGIGGELSLKAWLARKPADRPFLVLVRDRPTGAALFYGRVLSPNG